MNTFISAISSVTIVALIGFIAGKTKLVPQIYDRGFSNFILNLSLPVLLFHTVMNSELKQIFNLQMNIAFVAGLCGMFILTLLVHKFILRRNIQESAQSAFLCSYPNTAFLGIPLMLAIVGKQAMLPIVISNIIVAVLILPTTLILIELGLNKNQNIPLKQVCLKVIKTPLVSMSFLGLFFALAEIKLPNIIDHSLDLIGSSSSGISLFTLGLIISRFKIYPNKIVWSNVLVKNILHPLLMMFIIKIVGLQGVLAKELIILCAMPPAVSATFFSVLFDIRPDENITSTVLSTVLSIATISLFMYWVQL